MDDDVGAGDGVSNLGRGTHGGAQVDGHRLDTISAVSSSQHPLVADQGTAAPGAGVGAQLEGKSHLVGELTDGGGLAVGDATLDVANHGHLAGTGDQLSLGEGGGGDGQGENDQELHLDCCVFSQRNSTGLLRPGAGLLYRNLDGSSPIRLHFAKYTRPD